MRAWIVVLGLALANGALAQETDGEPLEREDDGYAAMADESDAELEPAPPQPVTVEATPGTVEGQLWALFESGVAQLPLKQDLVPANLPLVLTTDTLELFAPALKQ